MKTTKVDTFRETLELLRRLEQAGIPFRLSHSRDDALMIAVEVPGEHWEIEFVDYGDEVRVEIERYRSNGRIYDESMLDTLFAKHSDDSAEPTPEEIREHHEEFFQFFGR